MSARRFVLNIQDMPPLHGVLCDSPAECDLLMMAGQSGGTTATATLPVVYEATPESRGPGRPREFDEVLAAVIDELADELTNCSSNAARARLVRDRIGSEAPSQRTVETFLSAYLRPTQKTTQKIAQKFRRA